MRKIAVKKKKREYHSTTYIPVSTAALPHRSKFEHDLERWSKTVDDIPSWHLHRFLSIIGYVHYAVKKESNCSLF